MPSQSYVELKGLHIAVQIGTYSPDDIVPDAHLLDLTLTIAPHLVMVPRDDMALVFDYDPLIRQVDTLARASENAGEKVGHGSGGMSSLRAAQ